MTVTLDQIKKLREKTGVSTMACKEALVEAGGDESKAMDILREKGASKAANRSDRTTANGTVAIATQGQKAAMIALACETDFVAKNEAFMNKAKSFAETLLESGEDHDFSAELNDLNLQMGEKVEIHNKKVVEAPMVSAYLHSNNRIGVLVALSGGENETGQDIAMHIAAMNPKNLSPEEVTAEEVEKEKTFWRKELAEEGKPEDIIEKIMMGKEKKFRESAALLTQDFVKNPEQKIQNLLGDNKILSFWRFEV